MNHKEKKRAILGKNATKTKKQTLPVPVETSAQESLPNKPLTAAELRKQNSLKDGGHPGRNQNYRTGKTAHDYE